MANLVKRRVYHALPLVSTFLAFLGSPVFRVQTVLRQCNHRDTQQIRCPVAVCASLAGQEFLGSVPHVQVELAIRPIMQRATSALGALFLAMGLSVPHAQPDAVQMLSKPNVTCALPVVIANLVSRVSNAGRIRSRYPIGNGVSVLLDPNQSG